LHPQVGHLAIIIFIQSQKKEVSKWILKCDSKERFEYFQTNKKATKPSKGLVTMYFNGRGGKDQTPVDGAGNQKHI